MLTFEQHLMEDARKVKGMDIKKVVDDPEWQGIRKSNWQLGS